MFMLQYYFMYDWKLIGLLTAVVYAQNVVHWTGVK